MLLQENKINQYMEVLDRVLRVYSGYKFGANIRVGLQVDNL